METQGSFSKSTTYTLAVKTDVGRHTALEDCQPNRTMRID